MTDEEIAEQGFGAGRLGWETADAQHIVAAIDRLKEQQRIANLIALADYAYGRFGNYAGAAGGIGPLFLNPETESGNMRLNDEIRKGLGL